MQQSRERVTSRRRPRRSKVPEITLYFWIAKLLTTAMGEATSDFFVYHMNPYLAVISGGVVWALAMCIQFKARRYYAPLYWFAVTMVAIFGTMVADATHVALGVPYYASSSAFAVILAVVLMAWHASERTLSIHSIYTPRREFFYWATILSTFALGTATGDMTATTLRLGYLASGILFTVLFFIPGILKRFGVLNGIAAFWITYILTRPLGASYADYFGMPKSFSGLGYGKGPVALVLTAAIILVVGFLTITHLDIQERSAG
ncbi:hypothetical protein [Sulfobacillus harzensis]|uniref:Membrane-anchored protein n=1 Tax=Sulfobacillus harzensis TaxID=2729629 RepID=A0A7Y0L368_9FIRM|nr:hypothetical protein [Sulfobacillus harzensis]NMP22469.1 hypothetical protein [Sulfobacillus harzensis]